MSSTLVIRSQAATPRSSNPYHLSATPRTTSTLVAQARRQRTVEQGAPPSQGAAGTFAGTSGQSNSGDGTSPDDTRTATAFTPEYHNVFPIRPETDESFSLSPLKVAFAPPSTPDDFQESRSSPDGALGAAGSYSGNSYSGDYYSPSHPAPGGIEYSRSFSGPSTPQAPQLAQVADITSTPNHPNMLPASMQSYPPANDYTPTRLGGYAEESAPTTFDFTYQSNEMATLSYPDTTSHANSPFSSAQSQPSYHNQPPTYPQFMSYDDARSSMPNSMAPSHSHEYQTYDTQYLQPIRDNSAPDPTYPPMLPVNIASSSSPSLNNVSRDLSPSAHTSHSYRTASIQSTQEPDRTTEVSPVLSNRSSQLSQVGSTESVRRRVGIMLQTQYCQQAQQSESTSHFAPRRESIKPSEVRRESRDKRSPTSDDSEAGDAQGPTTSTPKDPVAKYKAAYQRVKLQRDFYERAASSLLHQVRMMGGDPMQASSQASKGEDLDPKKARILIASLQRELDNSRGKLIETQTQLHALRQSCDESSRSFARGFGGDYYPEAEDDHDNVPLSAAPTTIYNHLSKR